MPVPYIPPAFLFGSAGAGEWVVLFVVILVVVGPKRLPGIVRQLGRYTEMFRRAADEFKRQLMTMDQPPPKPYEPPPTDTTPQDSPESDDPYAGAYPYTDEDGVPYSDENPEPQDTPPEEEPAPEPEQMEEKSEGGE